MNKKELYIKHKKRIKSFLTLGTTVSAISLFAIFTEISISGAIGFIFGLIVLYFAYKSKKITLEIEKYCLKKCPICDKEIIKTEEIRYFVADNLVNEEAFNSQNYETLDYKSPVVLVVGSEGFGISRLVKEQADFNIKIKNL